MKQMDNYSLMPLYGFRLKYVGIAISILSLTLLFITEKLSHIPTFQGYSEKEFGIILLCLNGIALYFIAFSKEKHEDERISLIRDKTFRVSFGSVMAALIALTVSQMFFMKDVDNERMITLSTAFLMFMFLMNLGLITQIVVFYYRIFTNSDTASYDFTVTENIRNNKVLYLVFAIIYLAGIIALFLL